MKKEESKEKMKTLTVVQINDRMDALKSQIKRSVEEFFESTGMIPDRISVECVEKRDYVGPYLTDEPGERVWVETHVSVDLRI